MWSGILLSNLLYRINDTELIGFGLELNLFNFVNQLNVLIK